LPTRCCGDRATDRQLCGPLADNLYWVSSAFFDSPRRMSHLFERCRAKQDVHTKGRALTTFGEANRAFVAFKIFNAGISHFDSDKAGTLQLLNCLGY
jgi:hypothetical protein